VISDLTTELWKRLIAVAAVVLLLGAVPARAKTGTTIGPAPSPTETPLPPANELFRRAQDAFREKRYKDSRDLLLVLVARQPLQEIAPKARLMLASLEQDFQSSLDKFRLLATEFAGKPEGEEALLSMGNRYYAADRYDDAAGVYREFLDRYPKSPLSPEVRFFLSSSLSAQGKDEEAVKHFEKVVASAPDSVWAPKSLLGIGTAELKRKQSDRARKTFLRILDQYPLYEESNLVYYRLAQAYEELKKPREAHAAYATLVSRYPKALEAEGAKARMKEMEASNPALRPAEEAAEGAPGEEPADVTPPVVTVKEVPTPLPASSTDRIALSKPFKVQVGVFTRRENAVKLRDQCREAGYAVSLAMSQAADMPYPYYKVRIGSYTDRESARKAAAAISKKLGQPAVVVED